MNSTLSMPLLSKASMLIKEKKFFLFLATLVLLSGVAFSQCVPPTATVSVQPGAAICNGQAFNLVLSGSTVGTGPFDLTIAGPAGSATYNDIPVGGVITNFTPPTEKLWPAAPAIVPPTNDDAAVTLGVKFKSSTPGFVKGVRFFSCDDIAAPGSYTGQLWASDGTLLANGTFTVATNSSWQELVFNTPVLINANTTYIASYHTSGTKYVGTPGGFATGVTNGSLTAPDNISAGGNGVYAYGATASFPTNSVGGNYWVDVMFSPNIYTFNLTGVKDANECNNTGALQTLTINSGDCSVLPVNMTVNSAATTASVGQSFTVYVAADFTGSATPSGIDNLELHLAFDKTKLAVTSVTEQPIASAFTSKSIPLEASPFTNINATGQIDYAASTTGTIPVSDFNVLAITFIVTGGDGTSTSLILRKDAPSNETKAMSNGSSVLGNVINNTININAAGCIAPVATISVQAGAPTCNGQAFNLVLSGSTAGVAPFDLTITGPSGTATYNDIPVGGVISNFTPATEKLWPAAPAVLPASNEDASVTLGVKFRSSVSGFVKGVRFFSPNDIAVAPGSYTGQLWSAGGTLLASGTFTGVTTDSWQEMIFTTPVLIAANTTYVASYHTNGTTYVGTPGGFATAVTNGSLTAPDNASAGGNGVYVYGATASFPTNSVGGNYWVDVMFSPNVYTFNLTGIQDANGCSNTGALQTLSVSSGICSGLNLPVTLTNFSATPKDNNIVLHWTTSSEINNLGFEVQRSLDGSSWSALTFVNGAGNSNSVLKYSYTDEKLASGKRYYYRLKQIDIDKKFAYSPIVSAILDAPEGFSLEQNYPNPVRTETIIKFTLPQKAKVTLSLFDMSGRLVKVLISESKESGTHAVSLNSGALTKGLYFYKLQAGDFSAVKKMSIQ
ncbi:MAG: DUF4082 domain-containing protein [Chitinophagaceae bacterium]